MALITIDAVIYVARHIRVLEVSRVIAAVAAGALKNRIVVGIDVACGTHAIRVAVIDGKIRVLRVIKSGVGPRGGVMAILTSGGKELWLRSVAGIGRVVVVGLVASDAGGGQGRVVVVHVAITALSRRHSVRSGERECRVVVVEGRVGPDGGVVAKFAGGRESSRAVRRIVGIRVILLMTGVAERAVQRIVIVDMAIGAKARRHRVRTGELESGCGVIERSIAPENRVVAGFACQREGGGNVIYRRDCVVVIRLMAGNTGGTG